MYITIKQAAEMLGVCTKTITRRIDSGEIQAYRLTPRAVRIKMEHLQEYIDQHKS